ncbi:MAG: hypothetical protein GY940_14960 [bacterium]|nr:hypothetical protein [bacterium]
MKQCDGAVIFAFTRYHIPQAIEFPNSDKTEKLKNFRYPTVWNQLEAAMAYGLDLPLLILVERGLKREGMLSDRTEWFPQLIDIDSSLFSNDDFKGTFEDWKSFVEKRKAKSVAMTDQTSPAGEPIGKLLSRLTAGQLWKVLAAFATVIGAAFALGYWIGQNFGGSP